VSGEKATAIAALFVLGVLLLLGLMLLWNGVAVWGRFVLAFFPLVVVLFGVAFLGQGGLRMAVIGLVVVAVLAVFEFGTSFDVVLGASVYGFLKSFGISISVAVTMLMIFVMREAGALQTVSRVIKQQVVGNEVQALYIGVGFGSFLSALGVVTPALFPPLLVTMGFSPTAAIAIAVLGYDPTTSFSLLSIPITLPASIGGLNPVEMAFKVALFLPLVSTGFAFAILWLVGGRKSMRKAAVPALVCGLVLAFACLGSVSVDYFSGIEYVPLRIVGVLGGLCAMGSLFVYQRLRKVQAEVVKPADYPSRHEIWRSFSPWIVLSVLAAIVSVPQVGGWLSNALGGLERVTLLGNQVVDFDFLSQIYTWIIVAVFVSLFTLHVSGEQFVRALLAWAKRFVGPFLTYSLYFSISFVMAYSATVVVGGALTNSANYAALNMNIVLGSTLAGVFGAGYVFVAASLGLFGAIVGGSETSSNVLFLNIQKTAASDVGLSPSQFMTAYGSHAVAGGVASAVTPAKINNAVVTIDAGKETESVIMRKHLVVALLLTIATGILCGVLVNIGI
jgi:lactate permease